MFALLAVSLLASQLAAVGAYARAATYDEKTDAYVEITGYSVAGVLNVPNVYAITLHLRWHAPTFAEPVVTSRLYSLLLETAEGCNFQQATDDSYDGSYTVSQEPIIVDRNTIARLNYPDAAVSRTFYFLKTGPDDKLTIKFSFSYAVSSQETTKSGSNESSILVIKSAPDPVPPEPPQPEPEPEPEPVDTTKFRPLVGVAHDAALPLLDQDSTELSIPICNAATYTARRIVISLQPADKGNPVFVANSPSLVASLDSLSRRETKYAKFAVQLAPLTATGIWPVQLDFSYQNNHGDVFTGHETAYILVENQNAAPRLEVSCADELALDQPTLVKFTLVNNGGSPAHDVKAQLLGLDAAGVSVVNDVDSKYLATIESGGSNDVHYNLFAASSLEGALARLQLQLDFVDASGVAHTETSTIFLPLTHRKEEDKGVPRLTVSKYVLVPAEIRAGSAFTLNLELQNTSRSQPISNLKVTLQGDEAVFLPVNASNTLFIEQIDSGEVVPVAFQLIAKVDAENKAYALHINFDYEGNQGKAHSSQETISIPVRQPARLVVGEPRIDGVPMVHEMLPIGVEFYNMGKTMLHNLRVKVEGSFQVEGGSYFVGNFNPGQSDSFGCAVTPLEPGPMTGAMVFQFEDAAGNSLEIRRDFSLEVQEPFIPDYVDEPEPPQLPVKRFVYVAFGAVFLAAAAGGVFFWRRRRKRRMALMDAEGLSDATKIVVPEIEYVGFDTEPPAKPPVEG